LSLPRSEDYLQNYLLSSQEPVVDQLSPCLENFSINFTSSNGISP